MRDDHFYMECKTCCYGVSGPAPWDKADRHEDENPGHRMREVYDDE